jgi:S-adenosylmethionine:tRNA ribosyltransferase-isomerase
MHPRNISIKDYTYELPDERIAKYPLENRDSSRLLVYKDGNIAEDTYSNIADHIDSNTLLVLNNTRVIQARLLFQTTAGETIEIFCLEPYQPKEIATAMAQTNSAQWVCLVGRKKKWKEQYIYLKSGDLTITAELLGPIGLNYIISLHWQPEQLTFAELLDKAGALPIPPYLNRATEQIDHERYQTVYAQHKGSVAAPTAGLHFTQKVFASLQAKHIAQAYVTLHVGAGTFKPVKSDTMEGHDMHAELLDVDLATIRSIQAAEQVICVGTTALRTTESLYWMGIKALQNPNITIADIEIMQWDVYDMSDENIPYIEALNALEKWMQQKGYERLVCKTQIMIAPGYHLRIAEAIVTNFHQPDSTLLLLVAAVVGEDWKRIYDHALANDFRFLSYGDGSLLYKRRV